MKKIVTLIIAMVMAVGAFAVEKTEELDLSAFTAWASATYDATTKTITPVKAWGGGAIWYGTKDASNFSQCVLELAEACTETVQFQVTYADSYDDNGTTKYYSTSAQIAAGETKATLNLKFKTIRSISIQLFSSTFENVTIKLSKLYLYSNDESIEDSNIIWAGSVAMGNWENWVKIESSNFIDCNAGDKLRVHVTELTPSDGKVWLQNGSWANFDPNISYSFSATDTAPMDVDFTLTKDMLNTISSTGALIIKGQYYTVSEISLITIAQEPKETNTVNVTLPIWNCNFSCPDNWGNSEYIPAEKFKMVTKGAMLKVHVTEKTTTCQWPQTRLNTKGYKKMSESAQITDVDKDYSLAIPDDMVSEIKANGVRISGCGYTFDRVTLVTTVEVEKAEDHDLQLFADFDNACIKEFKTDETPKLSFSLVNPEKVDQNTTVSIVLTKDDGTAVNTYTKDVNALAGDGTDAKVTSFDVDLSLDVTEAGVYHFLAKYNGTTLCGYNIAYNLEGINCPADEFASNETSFVDFWKAGLTELAAVAPEYAVEEYTTGAKDTDTRTIYKVTMKSTPNVIGEEPVTVAGYLAVPKGEETTKHPVIVRFQGTDGGTSTVTVPSRTDATGWCEFIFSTRGQMLNRADQPTYYPEGSSSPDYYAYGLGDYHKHYYYGGYLDCKRAIDFVAQATVYGCDPDNIFATGGSQGGAFTYAAAALDSRVKAIAPGITGHADFKHNGERVSWPNNVFTAWVADATRNTQNWTMDDLYKYLRYFDVKNFSSMINCPCFTNFSLQDTTDPTHCNIVPYLLLTNVDAADKVYTLNNFLAHATAGNFNTTAQEFFEKYVSEVSTGIEQIENGKLKIENSPIYNLQGMRVSNAYKGIVIKNGKKQLVNM